jgi:hypothetical protein
MRLAPVFVFISTVICHGQESHSGRWEGSVKIPEQQLKLVVDLAQDKDGGWIGNPLDPSCDLAEPRVHSVASNAFAGAATKPHC